MPYEPFSSDLPLPKNWKQSIKSAVIHTVSLAFKTITLALGHLSDSNLRACKSADGNAVCSGRFKADG